VDPDPVDPDPDSDPQHWSPVITYSQTIATDPLANAANITTNK
jgi:hypothetical protein